MAFLRTNNSIDTRSFTLIEEFYETGTFTVISDERFELSDGGDAVIQFRGSGFTYDSDGRPLTGTIDQVRGYYEGERIWAVSEFELSVADFKSLIEQGWLPLVSEVLGGDDYYEGSDLGDILYGYGGNDTFAGGLDDDVYYVNGGDKIFEFVDEGIDLVFASSSFKLGSNVENLRLIGDGDINGEGNYSQNRLVGNESDNVLNGMQGNDILIGKGGADTFKFDILARPGNIDRIRDFTVGEDTIELDSTAYRRIDLGVLSDDQFKDIGAPGTRVDADDRIIYNSDLGVLFYDRDGSGSAERVRFAVVQNEAALTADDFFIV